MFPVWISDVQYIIFILLWKDRKVIKKTDQGVWNEDKGNDC